MNDNRVQSLILIVAVLALVSPFGINDAWAAGSSNIPGSSGEENQPSMITPEWSTFFATVFIEEAASYHTRSDGDLWPSAWSDDGYLYTANGDGKGWNMSGPWQDIVVNRIIDGHPEDRNLIGHKLAGGDMVGPVWDQRMASDGHPRYNRKPTGMVSVDGVLYMAVQDLNRAPHGDAFNDVPHATIVKSVDKGRTWTWNREKPMFSNYEFTTIWFLDFGQDGDDVIPGSDVTNWVYAYGMDHNWRDSFNDVVPDPTKIYLARIPRGADLQDINNWQWWTGGLDGGEQSWSEGGQIDARKPVLQDERRVYEKTLYPFQPSNMSVLSQGGVTYNKVFDRYIYTSWTEFTFEFYEAPNPWGPWRLFLSKDFGNYDSQWTHVKNGGYATTIPSKFIGDDGSMWVQSNTFVGGIVNYNFSLRQLLVTKYTGELANNVRSSDNLALTGENATPISKANFHFGNPWVMNDGLTDVSEDSWNGAAKSEDWWGWTWSKAYNMNKVVYTTGQMFPNGGWFDDIRIEVRQEFEWVEVDNVKVTPEYPTNRRPRPFTSYTFTFDDIVGDGVRVIGTPGSVFGDGYFTSIAELEVYFE